jgi:hypothetical protein
MRSGQVSNTVDRRIIGDTQHAVSAICYLNGDPYDWTGKTATVVLEEDIGTAITEAGTVTAHPTQAFTADATTDLLTCNAHGVKAGDQIVVASSATLPTGLTASTRYFPVEVTPNAFKVATLPNGPPIDITGAGSGTHTFYIVGSIQYVYHADEVDTASPLRGWFVSTGSGKTTTFPATKTGFTVDIQALGN